MYSRYGMGGYGGAGYSGLGGMRGYGSSYGGFGGYGSSPYSGSGYGMGAYGAGDFNSPTYMNGQQLDAHGNIINQQNGLTASANGNAVGPAGAVGPIKPTAQERRQAIEHRKRQRRLFVVGSILQIISSLVMVIMQTLRGLQEFAMVAFGAYFSYKAVRSFLNAYRNGDMISGPPRGMLDDGGFGAGSGMNGPIAYGPQSPVSSTVTTVTSSGMTLLSRLKWAVGAVALYILAGTAWPLYCNSQISKPSALEEFSSEEDDYLEDGSLSVETSDAEAEREKGLGAAALKEQRESEQNRKIFVAVYDHEASGLSGDMYSFKAGEQFIIDDYKESAWVGATRINDKQIVVIPGNYLRPLHLQNKF